MPPEINNRTKKFWNLQHPPELHGNPPLGEDPEEHKNKHVDAGQLLAAYNPVGKLDIMGFIASMWIFSFINFIKRSQITGNEFRCLMFSAKLRVDLQNKVPTINENYKDILD